jgi:Tfp pilus assembly protein PilO
MFLDLIKKIVNESVALCILSISCFIFAAGMHCFFIPRLSELKSKSDQLAHYKSFISSETGYAHLKTEIQDRIGILKGRIRLYSGIQEEVTDISSYYEILINKAKASDISFIKMQPQKESANQDFTLIPVILEFNTTYHALGSFLSSIEKLPHLYRIDRLALDIKNEGRLDVKLMINCQIPIRDKYE